MTGFEKTWLPRTIIIKLLYLGKENRCLETIFHESVAIHSPSIATPTVEWVVILISCHFR